MAWAVVLAYFSVVAALGSARPVPEQLTWGVVVLLLTSMVVGFGPVLVFLAVFVAWRENRRSPREVLAGLGLKRQGSARSLGWSLALFPAYAVVGIVSQAVASYVAPPTLSGPTPPWFPYYVILQAFFPVAVFEEAFGRGYLLDRLMPVHPSGLVQAMPAILLSAVLFTLYHLPPYLVLYGFSSAYTALRLAVNVFPLSVLLSVAYVRAKARNVAGPVLIHFLLDALPYVLFVVF